MSSQESQVDEQNTESHPTPGEMLRNAREKAGLSQQQMADKIFLKLKNVQDIENDHIDESMSATFAKGYVRMYAKQLGVDETAVLAEFDRIHTTPKPPAKLQSFSKRVAKQAHDDRWMMVTWVILFLLLAAFVAWWYQQSDVGAMLDSDTAEEPQNTVFMPAQQRDPAQTSEESVAAEVQTSVPAEAAAVQAPVSTLADSDESAGESDASAGPEVAEESTALSATAGSDNDSAEISEDMTDSQEIAVETLNEEYGDAVDLVFSFDEDCWINIEDATGEAIAYGVKAAGRVMPVSGRAPFKVTLGAPEGVSITFDGEAVDISRFQNGRIARFSLPMQD